MAPTRPMKDNDDDERYQDHIFEQKRASLKAQWTQAGPHNPTVLTTADSPRMTG